MVSNWQPIIFGSPIIVWFWLRFPCRLAAIDEIFDIRWHWDHNYHQLFLHMCANQRKIHVIIKRLKNWFEHISCRFSANEKTKCKCLISLSEPLHKSTKHVQKICAMPQYDDSFLLDCEKKRNVRSYKPYKKSAIANGTNDSTKPPQDYGTIGKWRKKYFTLKRIASTSPPPPPPPSMPIYRSMHSFDDNSTFNCKLNHNSSA